MAEYLDANPEPEPSGVNKFLKGLGENGFQSGRGEGWRGGGVWRERDRHRRGG